MKATLAFAQERFRYFNDLIFGGALKEPPIVICHVKTFLGKCTFKKKRKLFGKTENYGFTLRFNDRIDLPENELEDIIIHEMIHYYIESHQMKDSSAHGPVFRKMMQEINLRYGRHITITHKLTEEQRQELTQRKCQTNFIAVVTFNTGRRGIKVLPADTRKIMKYYHTVRTARGIRSVDLYSTDNPFFNRYPCSAAFNVFSIDSKLLDENIAGAKPLSQLPPQQK